MNLDLNGILDYQQNRYPYLMIDHATKIIPGKLSEGYKILKKDEWFFKVHWPSDPNMPGMLQIEALVQTAAISILSLPNNKGKVMYLTTANNYIINLSISEISLTLSHLKSVYVSVRL